MSSGPPFPTVGSAQVRELDRLTAERFAVPVGWLMEAAGWQVARRCRGRALVVCGRGNNGGDGLAAARHLHRWGRLAGVACIDAGALAGPAAEQARALRALDVELADSPPEPAGADLLVDALLGTGLSRPAEGRAAEWIERVNASGLPVLAVDVPSGLDADSGRAAGACVRAAVTVTLGLAKAGLLAGDGPHHAGEVWVADIGIPREAYAALGIEVGPDLFAAGDCFRLTAVTG